MTLDQSVVSLDIQINVDTDTYRPAHNMYDNYSMLASLSRKERNISCIKSI